MEDRRMPEDRLETLLEELRAEVSGSGELTDEQRAELRALQEQLRRKLGPDPDEPGDDPIGALRGQIDEFERTHPTLTFTLGRILDALNKMGI
jgi:hypothetical protein